MGVDAGDVGNSNRSLVTFLAARNIRRHELIEPETLVCSPPIHFGCLIIAGCESYTDAKRLHVRPTIESYPKPEQVPRFVVAIGELSSISQRWISTVAFGVECQHGVNLRDGENRCNQNQGTENECSNSLQASAS